MASANAKQASTMGLVLGANIAERRKNLGWTQAQLAECIGVDKVDPVVKTVMC